MRRIHARHFVVLTVEDIERRLLSEKMLRGVFQPLKPSEAVWIPNENALKAIRLLLADAELPEDIKILLKPYLDNEESAEVKRSRAITKLLTNFDTVPFAPVTIEEASSSIDELTEIYKKLNKAQKRSLAGDILSSLPHLQKTELEKPIEKLFWGVFDSIDDDWFDPGSNIAGSLIMATSFYWQKKDFESVIKIIQKSLRLQKSNDPGGYACACRHSHLANAYAEAETHHWRRENF